MNKHLLFFIFLSVSYISFSQTPIILDESFDEWDSISDLANVSSDSDNYTIKITDDSEYLYIYFELSEIVSIQNAEQIFMYLDTDNDPETGQSYQGIGAELIINFGNRTITYEGDEISEIGFGDIDMHLMPTVWSDKFEAAINKSAMVNDGQLFSGESFSLVVSDETNGIVSPVESGGITYTFENNVFDELTEPSLVKQDEGFIRVISHNVLRDKMFSGAAFQPFQRVYQLLDPDIIGFQEIYEHSAEETAELVEEFLPSEEGEQWYAAKVSDNIVVSRFPISEFERVNNTQNGAFILELETIDRSMLMINAHTPCCTNHDGRAYEIDAMMAYLRENRDDLEENTPIIIMGDMNLVGDPQNIQTFIDGDIQDEATWGSDFNPDWDGTNLTDLRPLVVNKPMTYTYWSEEGSGYYSSGRLDAMFFSDSQLELQNSFVLYSSVLTDDQLTETGLGKFDSELSSDHLPLVADFRLDAAPFEESIIPIEDIRRNDSEGVPELLGELVTVGGIVTVSNQFDENGPAYIQNRVGYGVAIYDKDFVSDVEIGDSVVVRGELFSYFGLTELITHPASRIYYQEPVQEIVPQLVSISDVISQEWDDIEELEGTLVQLDPVVINESGTFASGDYLITQGAETVTLRIDDDTDITGMEIPSGYFSVTGIITQFDTESPFDQEYMIMPRRQSDFELSAITRSPEVNESVSVFPVPSKGIINVTSTIEISQVTIYDQSGRNQMDLEFNQMNGSLDISSFKSGVYVIELKLEDSSLVSHKLVIQN